MLLPLYCSRCIVVVLFPTQTRPPPSQVESTGALSAALDPVRRHLAPAAPGPRPLAALPEHCAALLAQAADVAHEYVAVLAAADGPTLLLPRDTTGELPGLAGGMWKGAVRLHPPGMSWGPHGPPYAQPRSRRHATSSYSRLLYQACPLRTCAPSCSPCWMWCRGRATRPPRPSPLPAPAVSPQSRLRALRLLPRCSPAPPWAAAASRALRWRRPPVRSRRCWGTSWCRCVAGDDQGRAARRDDR